MDMQAYLILALITAAYFLPLIIATARDHPNAAAIAALNFLLGWTLLGWIAAFVWSLTAAGRGGPSAP